MARMSPPSADVSVRLAWPDDAAALAAVQVDAWRAEYTSLLPSGLLAGLEADQFTAEWAAIVARPADARLRVLVALERVVVRGYALTAPSPDPDSDPVADGELVELVVAPGHQRQGHGSRLLQAAVDTLRADRFSRATAWLAAADDARREFLAGAGWAPDGAHRELDLNDDGQVRVKQVRLHTDLGDP
jgi:GNAT superfamily N-acetyltransferase